MATFQFLDLRFDFLREAKMLVSVNGKMLADKIIRRKIYRQVPPKVEYILTLLGESLRPVMMAMCAWDETNARLENVEGSQARAFQNLAGMGLPTSRDSGLGVPRGQGS